MNCLGAEPPWAPDRNCFVKAGFGGLGEAIEWIQKPVFARERQVRAWSCSCQFELAMLASSLVLSLDSAEDVLEER